MAQNTTYGNFVMEHIKRIKASHIKQILFYWTL